MTMTPTPLRAEVRQACALALMLSRAGRGTALLLSALVLGMGTTASADVASDYQAIRGSLTSVVTPPGAGLGDCVVIARKSFPILYRLDSYWSFIAAGHYNDLDAGGRGALFAHDGWFSPNESTRGQLLENVAKWAGKSATPLIGVEASRTDLIQYLQSKGYTVRGINRAASNLSEGGVTVDVYFSVHPDASAIANIQSFTAAGKGFVLAIAPPWASDANSANFRSLLQPYGLDFTKNYTGADTLPMPVTAPSALHSALGAGQALVSDRTGQQPLVLADKVIAAASVMKALRVRTDLSDLNLQVELLSGGYGWIIPTLAAPLKKADQPVEAMLAYYQWSRKFDVVPPGQLTQLFADGTHPGASDWPGLPGAGSPVTKVVRVDGNAPDEVFMNHSEKPTRVETGLYAKPGATVTIALPADKVAAGLRVHIGGTEDDIFDLAQWNGFPVIWRRFALDAASKQVGHVFGGLITLLVPPGAALGGFDVTISGALEAPSFELGRDSDASWNAGGSSKPGAWGYLKTPKLTIYLPRYQLLALTNPTQVATHWKTVMDTTDYLFGYENDRVRGEVLSPNRQVRWGDAYANYPNEFDWGAQAYAGRSGEVFLNTARLNGEWGAYHELGHNYQANFQGQYVIPIGVEVDVNIGPQTLMTRLHKQSPWDNGRDASDRLALRQSFAALPLDQQTWTKANASSLVYDFYYNLVEAFPIDSWRAAFSRLLRFLKAESPAVDPELDALSTSDPNYQRNRFYWVLCTGLGRDLTDYFARYGLRAGAPAYGLTPSVVAALQAKGLPVWNGNLPPSGISNPGTPTLAENTSAGTPVHTFRVTDSDPGEQYHYTIVSGNVDGAFAIDRDTGVLSIAPRGLDYERTKTYSLTVEAAAYGVPFGVTSRPSIRASFTVNVGNVTDGPRPNPAVLKVFASGGAQDIATLTTTVEAGRRITNWDILSGNPNSAFRLSDTGTLRLSRPSNLPNPTVVELVVRAKDNWGSVGTATVKVLCNVDFGLTEQRWSGQKLDAGAPAYSGPLTSFEAAPNVGDDYSRKVSGYVVPSITGYYTFALASDDHGKLFVSSDASAANKALVATVVDYTSPRQWTKYVAQRSKPLLLEAGRAYYIEATQLEGFYDDHLAVGWIAPNQSVINVIGGGALFPARSDLSVTH